MKFGQLKVLLPESVNAVADIRMTDGRAAVFGRELAGSDIGSQVYSDPADGTANAGTLRLTVEMNTGNVEVSR